MADETKLIVEASRSDSKSSMVKTLLEKEPSNLNNTNAIINKRLQTTTSGLQKYLYKQLTEQVSNENSLTIADYILAQKIEVNLSDTYRANILTTLITISKFHGNKLFKAMTREDILAYLNNLRKTELSDPLHRWIGSYNEQRQRLAKFFKWLYNHQMEISKRLTPIVFENIPILKRKEQSIYRPTDIWSREEDLLFLRYCPNKRDRCYHAVSRDISGRVSEILGIFIRNIHFQVTADKKQYAEVVINGKTGTRSAY